jgi:hypothetical protein
MLPDNSSCSKDCFSLLPISSLEPPVFLENVAIREKQLFFRALRATNGTVVPKELCGIINSVPDLLLEIIACRKTKQFLDVRWFTRR